MPSTYCVRSCWLMRDLFVITKYFLQSIVDLTVSRITHERFNGCRPNMVGMGKGDPLEVINFRC